MSCIRCKNTKIELIFRKEIWKMGFRYRIHYPIYGRPDIVFPRKKIAIFIDGDFWHGYDWKNLQKKLKNDFWHNKIKGNIRRDKEVNLKLKNEGWMVIRIWEHDIKKHLKKCVNKIKKQLDKKSKE